MGPSTRVETTYRRDDVLAAGTGPDRPDGCREAARRKPFRVGWPDGRSGPVVIGDPLLIAARKGSVGAAGSERTEVPGQAVVVAAVGRVLERGVEAGFRGGRISCQVELAAELPPHLLRLHGGGCCSVVRGRLRGCCASSVLTSVGPRLILGHAELAL